MKWSFSIAKIAGTEVRIHLTFLLLLAWIGAAFWIQGGLSSALSGVALILTIFLCVVLHEFGHATAAKRYGIATPTITLLPFGGLASLTRIPEKPLQEFVIAIAGPLVNLFLAAVFYAAGLALPGFAVDLGGGWLDGPFFRVLTVLNLVLFVFNLIPAFPMDGGRIFRALLATVMPRPKATSVAATTGQALAIAGGFYALLTHQPILFLVTVFVFFAAGSEAAMVKAKDLLRGLTARDTAMGEFHTLAPKDTIQHATDLLLGGSQTDFPVTGADGRCVGVLTRNGILQALRDRGGESPVAEAASSKFAPIGADAPADEAWQALMESGLSAAPIVDSDGMVTAWLTLENLSETLMTREALAHEVG